MPILEGAPQLPLGPTIPADSIKRLNGDHLEDLGSVKALAVTCRTRLVVLPGIAARLLQFSVLLLLCSIGHAQAIGPSLLSSLPGKLPVLTAAHRIHSLTPQQAALAYPVRLRGVVTFYDPYQEGHKALFIADASGSIFIAPGSADLPELHSGSVITISGVTDPGGFAPIVANSQIRLLPGTGTLPQAHRVRLPVLLRGTEDGQWVELEGIVHSVEVDGMHVIFTIATDDGTLTATTIKEVGADYKRLVDSKVLLDGVAAPLVDPKRRMLGVRILFPGLSTLRVEEPAPADPFTLAPQHLSDLLRYSASGPSPHRVHVRGTVTLSWPGERVCIAEKTDAICIQTRDQTLLGEGQIIDAIGFLSRQDFTPLLSDGLVKVAGSGNEIVPQLVSPTEAFQGDFDGQLVRLDGTLIGISESSDNTTLLIRSDKTLFSAVLRSSLLGTTRRALLAKWAAGSTVSLAGIFSGHVDARMITRREGKVQLESFQLLLRSPADVQILESPSWWNASHTLAVLAIVGALTLAICFWVFALQRQVRRQTMIIRRSAEEFRHMAEHDTLTGLCVRRVFFEHLELAIQEAVIQSSSFALMMVDVDEFKQLNDSMGHATGDAVLVAVARRMQNSVRESDTVARIGGDEFIILLRGVPGMGEGSAIASKLLQSVSAPIATKEGNVSLTISIGVTLFPEGGPDSASLVKSADVALYRAKSRGRNCYESYSPSPSSHVPTQHRVQPA